MKKLTCWSCGSTGQMSLKDTTDIYCCIACGTYSYSKRNSKLNVNSRPNVNLHKQGKGRGNQMKRTIKSNWIGSKELRNGDVYVIVNEAIDVLGKYGTQLAAVMRAPNGGAEGLVRINGTSEKALIRAYGDETADWVGKEVKIVLKEMNVRGRMMDVIVLEPVI